MYICLLKEAKRVQPTDNPSSTNNTHRLYEKETFIAYCILNQFVPTAESLWYHIPGNIPVLQWNGIVNLSFLILYL